MISVPAPSRTDLALEIRRVREEAVSRATEVDLLVAAMRDHIKDLQQERDWLRAELARVHSAHALSAATWLPRGQKGNR